VWRSEDGSLFKRVGDASLCEEIRYQRYLAELGFPVPEQVDSGIDSEGRYFSVERSVGWASLHEQALTEAGPGRVASDSVIDAAVAISTRLLRTQAAHLVELSTANLQEWFEQASFAPNVYTENPDFDTAHTRELVSNAVGRLGDVLGCHSHLDYGLPNVFSGGVIDWQHHAVGPVGFDVYPMLEVAAFKGGNRGYSFTRVQRQRFLACMDKASVQLVGGPLSEYLGEFLLVKCFFFLALMRPADPSRHDKHVKWQYRRMLFRMGLEQYESHRTVDTESFPTLAEFTEKFAPQCA
jgi:hypothetical protein